MGIRHVQCQRFAKLFAGFPSLHEGCSGFNSQPTITGAIDKDFRFDAKPIFRALPVRNGGIDSIFRLLHGKQGGVQQQSQIRFRSTFFIEYQVKHRSRPLRITNAVLQADFLNDAPFPSFGDQFLSAIETAGAIRTNDVHPHLARRIATQHGPIVTKDHPRPATGRRQRARHAGRTATGNQDVAFQFVNLKRHGNVDCHKACSEGYPWLSCG